MVNNTLERTQKRSIQKRDAQKRYVKNKQKQGYMLLTMWMKISDKSLLIDLKKRLFMLDLKGIRDVISFIDKMYA